MKKSELEEYIELDLYNSLLEANDVTGRIRVRRDGDGGYEMVLENGDNSTPISNGLNENELADEVASFAHDLIRMYYVVTYVGLSDSDPDGNGYCEVKICFERHMAERVAKEWADREMEEQKDFAPSMITDKDKRVISWAGGSEKVIIGIHEERIKWV